MARWHCGRFAAAGYPRGIQLLFRAAAAAALRATAATSKTVEAVVGVGEHRDILDSGRRAMQAWSGRLTGGAGGDDVGPRWEGCGVAGAGGLEGELGEADEKDHMIMSLAPGTSAEGRAPRHMRVEEDQDEMVIAAAIDAVSACIWL